MAGFEFGDKIDVSVKGLEPIDKLAESFNNLAALVPIDLTFEQFIIGTATFGLTISISFYGGKAIVDAFRWLLTLFKK